MKYLLSAAVGVLAVSLAGQAAAAPVGHVGANYAYTDVDTDFGDAETDGGQVEGAVAFAVGGLTAAIDGQVGDAQDDGQSATMALTGHINTTGEASRYGAFLGVQDVSGVDTWVVGAEGLFTLSPSVNVYVQGGYGWSDEVDDLDVWAARVEARWFVSDNFRLDAGMGAASLGDGSNDVSAYNFAAGAEYQFAGTPWSIHGGYEYLWADDLANLDANIVSVGARYTFGGSLRDRENAGATLGSVSKLLGGGVR